MKNNIEISIKYKHRPSTGRVVDHVSFTIKEDSINSLVSLRDIDIFPLLSNLSLAGLIDTPDFCCGVIEATYQELGKALIVATNENICRELADIITTATDKVTGFAAALDKLQLFSVWVTLEEIKITFNRVYDDSISLKPVME